MAAKRRIRTGFATNVLCVLKHEGRANAGYFARRFGQSEAAAERALRSLERQGLVEMSTVMSPGSYYLTQRGFGKVLRSKACPGFSRGGKYDRPPTYVPMRGARRRRRR